MVKHVVHASSNEVIDGLPVLPKEDDILHAEIGINYAKDHETLAIKNDEEEIVTFKSEAHYQKLLDEKQNMVDTDLDTYAKTIVGAINENRRDAGAVREEVGSRTVSLGDVIYRSAKNGLIYNVSPDEWNTELGTPVGVAVIPANHIFGDRRARMISLYNVDSAGTPSSASYSSGQLGVKWSEDLTETPLANYNQVPVLESNETNAIASTSPYGYLPLQYTGGTRLENAIDTATSWFSDEHLYAVALAASPYMADGTYNENYSVSVLNEVEDIMNPLSDFDGDKNTSDLMALSGSFFTAAYAARTYKNDGDDKTEWYLPAMGELGYMGVRLNSINATIQKLNEKGGGALGMFPLLPKPGYGGTYWSSTEYSYEFACNLSTIDGRINDLRGKVDELSYLVRPFAIVELGEPILNAIDRINFEKQDRVTDNLTTDSNEIEGAINELDAHVDNLSAYTLNLDTTGQTVETGEIISHVSQTDGLVKVEKRPLVKEDIPTIEQNQVNNLPESLQEIRTYISGMDYTVSAETGYAVGYVKQEDGQVTAYVKELLQEDITGLPGALNEIRNTISGFDFTLSAVTGEAIGYVRQENGQVTAYTKTLIQDDIENLPEDLDTIRKNHNQLSADTHSKINAVSGFVENTINALSTEVHQSISGVSGSILSYVDKASGAIETTIGNLSDDIHQTISGVSGNIRSYIIGVSGNIRTTINNLSTKVYSSISGVSGSIISYVDDASDDMRLYVNNVSGNIENTIEQLSTDTTSAINNAINALDITPLTAGQGRVFNTITETNGKVSATTRNLVMADISGLDGAMDDLWSSAYTRSTAYTRSQIDGLDATASTTGHNVVTSVTQTNGKVASVGSRQLGISDISGLSSELAEVWSSAYTRSNTYADTRYNAATAYTSNQINGLDDSIGSTGQVITAVTQQNGKVTGSSKTLGMGDISGLNNSLNGKQKIIKAGNNITISTGATADTINAVVPNVSNFITQANVTNAINALDFTGVTAGTGQVVASVKQADGVVSATLKNITSGDVPTLPITKISNLQTTLNGKQATLSAGTGISIKNNEVSCTLDLSSYATKSYVDSAVPKIEFSNGVPSSYENGVIYFIY